MACRRWPCRLDNVSLLGQRVYSDNDRTGRENTQVTLFDTLSGKLDTLALLVSLLLHALDLFPDLVNVSAEHLGAHAGLFSVEVLLFEGGGDGLEDVCLLGAEMGGLCGEAAADDVVGVGGGGGGFMGGCEAGDEGGGELRGVSFGGRLARGG